MHTTVLAGFQTEKSGTKTRSTLIDDDNLTAFGVSGYCYRAPSKKLEDQSANFFYNAKVEKGISGWRANTSFYVPANTDTLAFYAYSPYGHSAVTLSPETATGPMRITYEVPDDVSDQIDLITAVTKGMKYTTDVTNPVPLTFSHALTAIHLTLGDNVAIGTIKEVRFENIYKKGTYTVGGSWDFTGMNRMDTCRISFGTGFDTTTAETLTSVDENTTLLLLPQDFTEENQYICVYFVGDDGTEYELRKKLQGTSWLPNTTVTYQITTSSINYIRLSEVAYPTSWGEDEFMLKADYENTDAHTETIGIFAVDKTTGEVMEANRKYTFDGASWSTTNSQQVHYNPNYAYYCYYPWQSGLGPTEGSTVTADCTADDFFASVINGWTVHADQSDLDKLTECDLQVSKGTLSPRSYLSFQMEHRMGLEVITLQSATATATVTYKYVNGNTAFTWSNRSIKAYATPRMSGNLACRSGMTMYFVTKAGAATTFRSITGSKTSWTNTITSTIASNECSYDTAELNTANLTGLTMTGIIYTYTSAVQTYAVPTTDFYQIECWGAAGGAKPGNYNFAGTPGYGGYTSGDMILPEGQTLYLYVGGVGARGNTNNYNVGGYNGGGYGCTYEKGLNAGSGGGGSTDVRLVKVPDGIAPNWLDFESLKSRVMVAAGGGGCNAYSSALRCSGGYGGGLDGGNGSTSSPNYTSTVYSLVGAHQTSTGLVYAGIPGFYGYAAQYYISQWGGGGGGGWYGGFKGCGRGGGGGSSFISGHGGCIAINQELSISTTPTLSENREVQTIVHKSGKDMANYNGNYVFVNTRMINGATSMPAPLSTGAETGHNNAGHIRITPLFTD